MRDKRESLQRQIDEVEAHLLLIEERKSQFVSPTSIDLQLIRDEDLKKKELTRLQDELMLLSRDQGTARLTLTKEDRTQIMMGLLSSERLEDRDACKAVVEKLSFIRSVNCNASLHVRTMSLLDECLGYSGGIEELVQVLASSYDNEAAAVLGLRPLHETLQKLLPQPVDWAMVTEAKALLKSLSIAPEILDVYYLESCPVGTRLPVTNGSGALFLMLDSLAKMPCRAPSTAPYLEFLLRLLRHVSDESKRLSAHITRVASDLGIRLEELREKVAHADAVPAAIEATLVYLMVKVTPSVWQPSSPEEPRRFLVDGWVNHAGSLEPLPQEDGEHTLTNLPALIERFVAECHRHVLERSKGRLGAGYTLTVEIFLPIELLDCDVDQWKIKIGKKPRPVGARYQLVVRSWDRLYDPEYWTTWDFWTDKWHKRPRAPLRAIEERHVIIASCDEDYCDTLDARLEQRGTVFMALSHVPPKKRPGGATQVFQPMLAAGTPIALWLRCDDDDVSATRDELHALVCGEDINALPSLVYSRRREAQTEEMRRRLWNDLTLLWDDPERLPPDITFGRFETPKELPKQP